MAYIGLEPSNSFVSLKRQVITGDGTTSYTLDHSVASVNDVAIFVNNVRQDPASYSISGTALTLGGTISSSDSCYVIFLGQALQTVTPATGTVTNAMLSSGTFSNITGTGTLTNFASTGIDDNADATAITIDSSENVGIGETSPACALQLSGTASLLNNTTRASGNFHQIADAGSNTYTTKIHNKASSPASQYINEVAFTAAAPDNNSARFFNMIDNSAVRCDIYSDGDIKNHDNSYGSLSDQRIKQDIVDSGSQWNDIKAVKVRKFKKKDDVRQYGDKAWVQIGVIAQELEAAGMDKLVRHSEPSPSDILSDSTFGTLYEDGDKIPEGKAIGDIKEIKEQVKGVGYSVLYMKAIKALQEAMTRIEELETRIQTLENK
jgi:hypothetical protein